MAKSSKSHPTDSDVGVRTSESGVGRLFAGLQANRPRRCRFQPSVRSFAIGTKSGPALRKKERRTAGWRFQEKLVDTGFRGALPYIYKQCRLWRHNQSALSFDAEKEGASCGASATGWRIGLILRAPCSAVARAIPRRTTCGGFWYFWPQKYKKKKVCGNCDFPEPSQTFSVKFRKTFFLCFSVAKSSKSHPTDSDVGVRRTEGGVGRLRGFASKPSPSLSLSALRPLFRHRNQVGEGWHIKKQKNKYFVLHNTKMCIIFAS